MRGGHWVSLTPWRNPHQNISEYPRGVQCQVFWVGGSPIQKRRKFSSCLLATKNAILDAIVVQSWNHCIKGMNEDLREEGWRGVRYFLIWEVGSWYGLYGDVPLDRVWFLVFQSWTGYILRYFAWVNLVNQWIWMLWRMKIIQLPFVYGDLEFFFFVKLYWRLDQWRLPKSYTIQQMTVVKN